MRILLLTAALLAAFSINALAYDLEDNESDDTQVVTVNNPLVYLVNWSWNPVTFTLTQGNVLDNNVNAVYPAGIGLGAGSFVFSTNVNNTSIFAQRSDWTYSGDHGHDPIQANAFSLRARVASLTGAETAQVLTPFTSTTYGGGQTIPNGTDAELIRSFDGDVNANASINFKISDVGINDDPGTYTSTVTWTMGHDE